MMKKRFQKKLPVYRLLALLIAICVLTFLTACGGAGLEEQSGAGPETKLAGYYVCFEEMDGRINTALKQGILTIQDSMITKITEYREGEPDVMYLDPSCVIMPGFLDLHSHVDYNDMQLWFTDETDIPWDNRFEWRTSANYVEEIKDKFDIIAGHWEDAAYPGETDVCRGEILEYFVELQAAAGGTTLIQGVNNSDEDYDSADSHAKLKVIRNTGLAEDLDRQPGNEVRSMVQIFIPDAELSVENPSGYLPPINTSSWNPVNAKRSGTEDEYLSEILESIGEKTNRGFLIHLAEGRAGNFKETVDAYSRKEFDAFCEVIEEGVRQGNFTVKDVRNAHFCLIHACAVDPGKSEDRDFLSKYGIGLIWSPVSNLMLYGDTPDFAAYMDDPALMIALGSDWSPSGSKTVWEEARFSYDLIRGLGKEGESTRENLLKACTVIPAKMLGEEKLGNIVEDGYADLFLLKTGSDIAGALDPVLEAFAESDESAVEAVFVRGRAIIAEKEFLKALNEDEIPGAYGKYRDAENTTDNKYFYVPEIFAGKSFSELYSDCQEILHEANIEISAIRGLEDPLYNEAIQDLEKEKVIAE